MPTFKVTTYFFYSTILHLGNNIFLGVIVSPYIAKLRVSSEFLKFQEYTIP